MFACPAFFGILGYLALIIDRHHRNGILSVGSSVVTGSVLFCFSDDFVQRLFGYMRYEIFRVLVFPENVMSFDDIPQKNLRHHYSDSVFISPFSGDTDPCQPDARDAPR